MASRSPTGRSTVALHTPSRILNVAIGNCLDRAATRWSVDGWRSGQMEKFVFRSIRSWAWN